MWVSNTPSRVIYGEVWLSWSKVTDPRAWLTYFWQEGNLRRLWISGRWHWRAREGQKLGLLSICWQQSCGEQNKQNAYIYITDMSICRPSNGHVHDISQLHDCRWCLECRNWNADYWSYPGKCMGFAWTVGGHKCRNWNVCIVYSSLWWSAM